MALPDPYRVDIVRFFLTFKVPVLNGSMVKAFSWLGDRLAASILMAVDESALSDPEIARRVCRALSIAFSETEGKKYKDDRIPRFSIYLLQRIMAVATDSDVKERVGNLILELNSKAEMIRNSESE